MVQESPNTINSMTDLAVQIVSVNNEIRTQWSDLCYKSMRNLAHSTIWKTTTTTTTTTNTNTTTRTITATTTTTTATATASGDASNIFLLIVDNN